MLGDLHSNASTTERLGQPPHIPEGEDAEEPGRKGTTLLPSRQQPGGWVQGRLCGLCPHLPLLSSLYWGAGTSHPHFHGVTEDALHQSHVCRSFIRHHEDSTFPRQSHCTSLLPSHPGKAFIKGTGPQAIWSHDPADIPLPRFSLLTSPPLSSSLTLLLPHHPAVPKSPRYCGSMAFALSVPSMKCSFPKMTMAVGVGMGWGWRLPPFSSQSASIPNLGSPLLQVGLHT